jgi:hypothetical protein
MDMAESDSKRYFQVEEAEALIPRLEEIVAPMMDAHSQIEQFREAIQTEQQRIMFSGGFAPDVDLWQERKASLDRLVEVVQDGAKEILSIGAVPKDLGIGLVDFPSLLHGRAVNLCWRYGEKAIRFWHGLDEGYTARKSLPQSEV